MKRFFHHCLVSFSPLFAFLFAFLLWLLFATLPPFCFLYFWIPPLVFAYYHATFPTVLLLSFFLGFSVDLFAATPPCQKKALLFCLTSAFLYPQRDYFFQERISTIPFLTFLFTFILYSLHWLSILLTAASSSPPFFPFLIENGFFSLFHALFALCFFIYPLKKINHLLQKTIF